MAWVRLWGRERFMRSLDRGRRLERPVEVLSRRLWPRRLRWLAGLVVLLALLDILSTYAFLELSGKEYVYEAGILGKWALRTGGFVMLFLVDITATMLLTLAAIAGRRLYFRLGLTGFGRAAFVLMLIPYSVATLAAIFNNVLITFI